MNCPSCDSRVREGAKICAQCGTRLGGTSAPVIPPSGDRAATTHTSPYLQPSDATTSSATAPAPAAAPTQPTGSGHVTSQFAPADAGQHGPAIPESTSTDPGTRHVNWALVGICAAVVAVCGVLVVVFLGGKASSSKFSSVDAAVNDGAGADTPDVSETPSTDVGETSVAMGGSWPTAPAWATSRCRENGYGAATAFETENSKIVICKDPADGTYYYQGYGKQNGLWSPWLEATYSSSAEHFVATNTGSGPSTTYEVTPSWLSITTGDQLVTFETARLDGAPATLDDDQALGQLEALIETSSRGRGAVVDLAHRTYGGEACPSSTEASSAIESIIDNRSHLLDAARNLQDAAASTTAAAATRTFTQAMDASLRFDQEFQRWIGSDWPAHAAAGCPGGIAAPASLDPLGVESTHLKEQLADEVNRLAAGTSFKSDWKYGDI